MRKFHLPRLPPFRREWVPYVVAALVSLAFVIFAVWFVGSQSRTIQGLQASYESLHSDYQRLYSEAVTGGVDPVAPAPDDIPDEPVEIPALPLPTPGETGETGETGPRGPGPTQAQVVSALATYCAIEDCTPAPTVAQVAAAISDYCATGGCRGADGENGEPGQNGEPGDPGRPPTAEEIAIAVAAYCNGGACRGADGADGEPGPPPTDAQVLEQVRVYCSENNNCQGRTGDTGERGATGVGIETVTCPDDENDDWVYTFTDGSTQIVAGPCRVTPLLPPPDPSPSPTMETP